MKIYAPSYFEYKNDVNFCKELQVAGDFHEISVFYMPDKSSGP